MSASWALDVVGTNCTTAAKTKMEMQGERWRFMEPHGVAQRCTSVHLELMYKPTRRRGTACRLGIVPGSASRVSFTCWHSSGSCFHCVTRVCPSFKPRGPDAILHI